MRTKKAKIRETIPDTRFRSAIVAKLINRSMQDGKKSVAQKQVYAALEQVAGVTKKSAVEVLDEVLRVVMPQMEVRTRRVGGASYQVPMPVRGRRGQSLVIRWLVAEANKRPNKQFHSYAEKLAAEMLDALDNKGGTIEKRNVSHRMAEANKAFSHFRW
ncbi:MAG TPA: 30S ribosomal protein S7 [Candidatus Pacebacteria bacterium]|nr:30S ribosomal protein S7 [Candidatus Paceibacterota bacterium]